MTVNATAPAIMHRQVRRSGVRQMDLFRAGVADGTPAWTDLPEDARDALVGLMTQLILKHARTRPASFEAAEAVHDC
jgi:hypothetical protein